MSDERQAFEQLHAIPSGVEWCEKRHIYIHKNYSGLVLHPINESWKAFCEGALWQASRQALEGEAIGEVGYMIQPNWDDPSKTKGVALVDKSLAPGTKLYTYSANFNKPSDKYSDIVSDGGLDPRNVSDKSEIESLNLNQCRYHGEDYEACATYSGQIPCDAHSRPSRSKANEDAPAR